MESGFLYIIINEKLEFLSMFYIKIINLKNYRNTHFKIIDKDEYNNIDIYKNLYLHLIWLDRCYKLIIYSSFIIIISIFMNIK